MACPILARAKTKMLNCSDFGNEIIKIMEA